jgi:hypothetical protein
MALEWRALLLVTTVVLNTLQPVAFAVKLHFTKIDTNGTVVYSVADANVDLPPPPEGRVLVGCLSSCHNTLQRLNVRNTWGKFPGNWVLRFILSDCPTALHENSAAHNFHDLIMTNVTEDYKTIPAKSAAIFAYAKEVKAKWAFKTDDDSFVNIPQLLKQLGEVETENYVGKFYLTSKPFRDPNAKWPFSKWYVSETDYPSSLGRFPPYAAGPGYAFRDAALDCLMNQIATTEKSWVKGMWMEDVYMGMLAKECELKRKEIGPIWVYLNDWLKRGSNPDFVVIHYVVESRTFLQLYALLTGEKKRKEIHRSPKEEALAKNNGLANVVCLSVSADLPFLDRKTGDSRHGDVCRDHWPKWKVWGCPAGCTRVEKPPYCMPTLVTASLTHFTREAVCRVPNKTGDTVNAPPAKTTVKKEKRWRAFWDTD